MDALPAALSGAGRAFCVSRLVTWATWPLGYACGVHATRTSQLLLMAGGVLATIVLTVAAVSQPVLGIGALAVTVLVVIAVAVPRVAIAVWLAVVVFVPYWTTVSAFGVTVNTALIAVPVILGIVLRRLGGIMNRTDRFEVNRIDMVVVAGVAASLLSAAVFDQASFLTTNVALTLFGGYIIGRLAKADLLTVYGVMMIILAVWGIVEFLTGWHAFEGWLVEDGGIGPLIQERGGLARSEASLGHAIAYGACLAAAIPIVRNFRAPLLWQLILAAGVLTSVSRGPIIAAVFAFALIAWTTKSGRVRFWSGAALVAGLIGVHFFFTLLYEGAGQSDVTLSQQARDAQVAQTMSLVNLFGPATGTQMTQEGLYIVNGVDRVDSAWLRLGLDFGWITAALLLFPVAVVAWRVLTRRAGTASLAFATQIPIILVTSFITQWQTIFFVLAGLAISESAVRREPEKIAPTPKRKTSALR